MSKKSPPKKDRQSPAAKNPRRALPDAEDFDPHAHDEYQEIDSRAFDPHKDDFGKPNPTLQP